MNKRIINKNNKGQYHGYQQWYGRYGKLDLRANFKNSKVMGYAEVHVSKNTNFYIK